MSDLVAMTSSPGFDAPVHRALTEPILIAGAPRAVAILNGTLAAAVGLGLRLWIVGLVSARARTRRGSRGPRDATRPSLDVVRRHLRYPAHFGL